ncbi:MAG TPA: hypothetical protein VFO16_06260 [Pseudonocardiaceae bacterium]|nr:hypothetical protein [Pseudonocardiaceae bacterium]
MIGSGEAESRAIAGAVRDAIGQARLDAGVNLAGLLAEIGSADSVDYRQLFMCWHLTRTLRPSLVEQLPPAMVRDVLGREAARSKIVSPHGGAGPAMGGGDGADLASDLDGIRYPGCEDPGDSADPRWLRWFGDGIRESLPRELCRVSECAHA